MKNLLRSLIFVTGVLYSTIGCKNIIVPKDVCCSAGTNMTLNAELCCENNGELRAVNEVQINARTVVGEGSISGTTIQIFCEDYLLSGPVAGSQECFIAAKNFKSSGSIEGKKVIIICHEFNFDGSILADECMIYSKKAFDHTTFTRNPQGKYTIIITPYIFTLHTYESLLAAALSTFVDGYLNMPDRRIKQELNKIRIYAYANQLDGRMILAELKNKIEEKLTFVKEKLNNKYSILYDLKDSIWEAAAGTMSVSTAYLYHRYVMNPYKLYSTPVAYVPTALLSLYALQSYYRSYAELEKRKNHRYAEKHHALSLILAEIEECLKSEDIPGAHITEL